MLFNIPLDVAFGIYAFGLLVFVMGVAMLVTRTEGPASDCRLFGIACVTAGLIFMITPMAPLLGFLAELTICALYRLVF